MPAYRIDGNVVFLTFSGKLKRNPPPRCRAPADTPEKRCGGLGTYLCDYPVGDEGQTCSMPICAAHRHQAGPNLDYCPMHRKVAEQTINELPLFKGKP